MPFDRRADPALKRLRRPVLLTQSGLVAERAMRAFWPLASVLMAALAALMLGLHLLLPESAVWTGAIAAVLAAAAAFGWGAWRFRWPARSEALARLDATLPGRPVAAMLDTQAVGAGDAASIVLWQAHQRRMAEAAAQARAPAPDLNVAAADPYALRYAAGLFLAVALLFGSVWQAASIKELGADGGAALNGPAWEGWAEPPDYTRLPVLYLNDQAGGALKLPEGSRVTLRFYGEAGALSLSQSVAGPSPEPPPDLDGAMEFDVRRSGTVSIDGTGGRSWQVEVIPDQAPRVAVAGRPELESDGYTTLAFAARDDYGVAAGQVRIALDLAAVERRHGLAADPDPREALVLDLPLPLSGSRKEFTEKLIEDFARHPWANLPVVFTFSAVDAAGQSAAAAGFGTDLVTRRFFDPLAAAVIEQRRDLLWARANAPRTAQILRTLSHRPEDLFRDYGDFLRLRTILRRLESYTVQGSIPEPQQAEIAAALWDLAIQLEEGDVGDALERMQRAQERLSQAMRDGASDQEIAQLMQELREATEDYMRQLSRQAEANGEVLEPGEMPEDMMTLSQDDLQAMMDRIQELMQQGRMAEAEQALREFQEMMENMRMTRAQQRQGEGSQGREAMEGLGETLREQQGLSDQAFRDLQEQFNPGARSGESQGNEGRDGGLGRGQSHQGGQGGDSGQDGQGSDGAESRTPQGSGPDGRTQPGADGSLADRQQALRRQLQRQQEGLPYLDGEAGDAAREALDRAGRAMEGAEDALRGGDMAEAIDQQSEAMEALREGMRNLGQALAQREDGQRNGQGQPSATAEGERLDPLGRSNGSVDDGGKVGEGNAYRRAWNLLEDIRRRAGERDRSERERNYLQRLLDRF
ncbi:TIGR02302 family protein [Leisingera methylohalidivorans]|uniref:ATPase n=1 Tax=Leisingera methylohalidivorans DSM 14336 TaxID=999552 RepID=V9VQA2_9RHOB|nr:TIGR02302 family protein [Leisingera methylohalidivorans]AHC99863.1 ATPase [Leisingera methylohalidivorans DSM 14336]